MDSRQFCLPASRIAATAFLIVVFAGGIGAVHAAEDFQPYGRMSVNHRPGPLADPAACTLSEIGQPYIVWPNINDGNGLDWMAYVTRDGSGAPIHIWTDALPLKLHRIVRPAMFVLGDAPVASTEAFTLEIFDLVRPPIAHNGDLNGGYEWILRNNYGLRWRTVVRPVDFRLCGVAPAPTVNAPPDAGEPFIPDGRLNTGFGDAVAALYNNERDAGQPAVALYGVNDHSSGYLLLQVTAADLAPFASAPPDQPVILYEAGPAVAYILQTGEVQINIREASGKITVFILRDLSSPLVYGYTIEPPQ